MRPALILAAAAALYLLMRPRDDGAKPVGVVFYEGPEPEPQPVASAFYEERMAAAATGFAFDLLGAGAGIAKTV